MKKNMKELDFIIVMLIMSVSLVSCKESLIPEGLTENRKITYVMTNDTDAQVSVTSYSGDSSKEISLGSKDSYQYWEEKLSGKMEEGKIAFFRSDSLDIVFQDGKRVRLISGTVDASRNNDMLEAFWHSSDEGSMKYLMINESLKNTLGN